MTLVLLLQVLAESSGGWRISLGELGCSPALGSLSPQEARSVLAAVQAELSVDALPVLLIPGDDVAVTSAEDRVGQCLARVLEASPSIVRAVAHAVGAAIASGRQLVVLVDVRDDALRRLPWECMACEPAGLGIESGGAGVVVRLAAGQQQAGQQQVWRPRLRALLWCGDVDDPGVSRLGGAVGRACLDAAFAQPVAPLRPPTAAETGLIFLIGHGEVLDQQLRLLSDAGSLSPGTLAHSLQPWLAQTALVVVLICEGGHLVDGGQLGLVDRLIAAGAGAVVASDARVDQGASVALADEIVASLGRGAPVGAAVAAGRRAVRGLAQPFPDARWWRFGLTVAHAGALAWAPGARQLSPQWRPDDSARTLLCDAVDLAAARGHHWLGVEHLVLAVLPHSVQDRRLRLAIQRNRTRLATWLDGFESADAVTGRLSPRLARVRATLPDGFGIGQLFAALLDDLPAAVAMRLDLVPVPSDATLSSAQLGFVWRDGGVSSLLGLDQELQTLSGERSAVTRRPRPLQPGSGGPWTHLEVVGGPEDGRRVALATGDLIGRASVRSPAAHSLYDGAGGSDPYLSRRHLRGDVDGAVVLQRRAHRVVGRKPVQRPKGRVQLQAGDALALTSLTWLFALGSTVTQEGD